MEKILNPHRKLENLPIEMIDNIFKYLRARDLAAISATCRKYRNLAHDRLFAERKRDTDWIHILAKQNDIQCRISEFKSTGTRFSLPIRNLSVESDYCGTAHHLFKFIRHNCAKHINSLIMNSTQTSGLQLERIDLEMIADQIKNLKMLLPNHNLHGGTELWDFFQNIETLFITYLCPDVNGTWMTKHFPKLQTFCIHVNWENEWFDLRTFLRQNPQLKTVYCSSVKDIRKLLTTEIALPNAMIRIDGNSLIFSDDFQMCSQLKKIHSLDIVLNGFENYCISRTIFRWDFVKGLHFRVNREYHKYFKDLSIYLNIKRLSLRFDGSYNVTEQELKIIVKSFPNVHELRLEIIRSVCSSKRIILNILGGLWKLKDFYYYCANTSYMLIDRNDLNEMNAARLQLKNATFVTIHVEESDLIGLKKNDLKLECVSVALAKEFKYHYFNPILYGDHKTFVNYLKNLNRNDNEN